jgi:hypothetical protein
MHLTGILLKRRWNRKLGGFSLILQVTENAVKKLKECMTPSIGHGIRIDAEIKGG